MKYKMFIRATNSVVYSFKDIREDEMAKTIQSIEDNRMNPNAFLMHVREDRSVIMINSRHIVTIEFVPEKMRDENE